MRSWQNALEDKIFFKKVNFFQKMLDSTCFVCYCLHVRQVANMHYWKKKQYSYGQVVTEYAVMAAIFVVAALSLLVLLAAVTGHGWRVLSLLAWEPFS